MNIHPYLQASDTIDFHHPAVADKAAEMADGCCDKLEIARRCFQFVRDEIRHSCDYQLNPVTCRASDVLEHRTGYCYAKSHLLAALLRACGIPTGLCYQRLSIDGDGPPFCLHGLNAAHFEQFGWYRMDARGNKPGVEAEFDPPNERLAFTVSSPGEFTLPTVFAEPLPIVIQALERHQAWDDVLRNLPDVELSEEWHD